MTTRKQKRNGNGQNKEELSREARRRNMTLFIQQFEKEAQERLRELETKAENMLATVDKFYKVELMKNPTSLHNTLLVDLLRAEEMADKEGSIAMKRDSSEMPPPLKMMPSKRKKSSDSSPVLSTPVQRSSSKTSKRGKGGRKQKTLVGSSSTGCLPRSSVTSIRTRSQTSNSSTTPNDTKPKLRSVFSAGDVHCAMGASSAHITVTTGRGETLSFSEETKNEINWELVDDVAWHHIEKLTSLMENLSQQKNKEG